MAAQHGAWRRLGQPRFGLANRISDAIATREWREPGVLYDPRGSKEVLLACDFAGAHQEAKYEGFGFVISAIGQSREWMERRASVRARFLADRRMSYKGLNDRVKRRALRPFLDAAGTLPGNVIIFLISKRITKLFCDPGDPSLFPELVVAERGWNQKSFQRLLLVGSLGALLLSGLSATNQDILWVSDQDEIAPNPRKHNHAGHVIHHCIERYSPESNGVLTFLTTEGGLDSNRLEDAVAITDLAAGALVDAFSDFDTAVSPDARGIWLPVGTHLSEKARTILEWLAADDAELRPLVIILDKLDDLVGVEAFRPMRYRGDGPRGRWCFLLR